MIRRQFAFGVGSLTLKGVGAKFCELAQAFEQDAAAMDAQALKAEIDGQPLAAKRMRHRASKLRAEGEAIKHSGWHRWKAPLAPRADGTRKVAYQSIARSTCFEIIGLIYWGLQARMPQSLETARLPVERQGKQVTNTLGLRTKDMRARRSLGSE